MGFDYALVHLFYTIPPAVLLTVVYAPLFRYIDVYKIAFLIVIAVVATIPWDSYLIRNKVWGYPPDAVLGATLLEIPVEELFFFVIQTYNTSLLYLILSKPTFHVIYLRGEHGDRRLRPAKWAGAALILGIMAIVECLARFDRQVFYTKLIFIWAGPFLLLLWLLSYQFLINLPWWNTVLPIAVPTLYLWIVDTIALRRGTWVIKTGTKLNWQLWRGLDFEEATFFVVTNTLIVFGQVAFDNALAVLDLPPNIHSPLEYDAETLPSPFLLMRALLVPVTEYNDSYINGLQDALDRLRRKSRSFYVASGAFPRDLRRNLILLLADDLIDEASTPAEGQEQIQLLREYLNLRYDPLSGKCAIDHYMGQHFPEEMRFTIRNLPTDRISAPPLFGLLEGFSMDLLFASKDAAFHVADEAMLEKYATLVASTVAEMCIELISTYATNPRDYARLRNEVLQAGREMGVALQYVNIARDIRVDARMGRVYVPTTWLVEQGLKPHDILDDPDRPEVESLRLRLLDQAFGRYQSARSHIDLLPYIFRGPVRVMIESYMEIGRTLQSRQYRVRDGKATVGRLRRLWVAWKALIA